MAANSSSSSGAVGTVCELCGETDMLLPCLCCGKTICTSCVANCEVCGEDLCPECLPSCHNCGLAACYNCGEVCCECGSSGCTDCMPECDTCHEAVCHNCNAGDHGGSRQCKHCRDMKAGGKVRQEIIDRLTSGSEDDRSKGITALMSLPAHVFAPTTGHVE